MRADRHLLLRRLRVLLACAVMLWGAGVAVPPAAAAEIALVAPRTVAAQRTVAPRPALRPIVVAAVERPAPPLADSRLPATPVRAGVDRGPLYLRHCALLL